jgi:hypothetical protein
VIKGGFKEVPEQPLEQRYARTEAELFTRIQAWAAISKTVSAVTTARDSKTPRLTAVASG